MKIPSFMFVTVIPMVAGATTAVMYYGSGALLLGSMGGLLVGQFLAMCVPFVHAGYLLLRGPVNK